MVLSGMMQLRLKEDPGHFNKQTYEEYQADPFGEKKRLEEAQKLDLSTKLEWLKEQFSKRRTSRFVEEMGLSADNKLN